MTPFFCAGCGTQYGEAAPGCPGCGRPTDETKQRIAATEPLVTPDGGPVGWRYGGELRGTCPACGTDGEFPELGGWESAGVLAKELRSRTKAGLWRGVTEFATGLAGGGKVGLLRKCGRCNEKVYVCRTCMRANRLAFVEATPDGQQFHCHLCGNPVL
jgi:hypothetical protein